MVTDILLRHHLLLRARVEAVDCFCRQPLCDDNCTWYVYERRLQLGRPISSFWGNANTWATSARAAGFVVNNTPAPDY